MTRRRRRGWRSTAIAYGLDRLDDTPRTPASMPGPGVPSLWSWPSIGRLVTADSQVLEAAAPTTIAAGGEAVPVWLVVRARSVGAGLRARDCRRPRRTGRGAALVSGGRFARLSGPGHAMPRSAGRDSPRGAAPAGRFRPERARRRRVGPARGARLGAAGASAARRVGAGGARALAPRAARPAGAPRALRLLGSPRLLVLGGSFVWVAHGYLASATFPGSTRITEGAGTIGALEAGLLGTVDAATGATTIYLLPDAGPLHAQLGRDLTGRRPADGRTPGAARPDGAVPTATLRRTVPDPGIAGLEGGDAGRTGRRHSGRARPADRGLGRRAPTGAGGGVRAGRCAASPGPAPGQGDGRPAGGWHSLRLGDDESLPGPAAAQALWDRFPSYEQLLDSVARSGSRFERGPYRVLPDCRGPRRLPAVVCLRSRRAGGAALCLGGAGRSRRGRAVLRRRLGQSPRRGRAPPAGLRSPNAARGSPALDAARGFRPSCR